MLVSKLKIATVALLVVLACVGGGTVALLPVAAGRQPNATQKQDVKQQAAKKAEDAFPGEWVWAGGSKHGYTRIAITKTDDGWTVQVWGEHNGKEHGGDKNTLTLLRDYEEQGDSDEEKTMNKYGLAIMESKAGKGIFAKSYLTLRVENDRLLVEDYRIFIDKSDRPNYRTRCEFKKK